LFFEDLFAIILPIQRKDLKFHKKSLNESMNMVLTFCLNKIR